ncbi:MAG TPA: creatininase family protein [Acidimicrobiales bacterium]|jgi:creatinine amidohydrolase|nr:creatininase family protein [Acidimicrobiales bacterium]
MPVNRLLANLRAPEIAEYVNDGSILIQPLGSIEQHGPHLPFSTDLIVAEATARETVARYGDELDLWLLPPLAYTKSNEHAWSAGTVWLSATTLLAVLNDVARSLSLLPARRLVFLNGHGGNSSLLNVACREIRLAHGFMTFLMHPSVPPDQGGRGDPGELGMGIHGGRGETSMMLHLRPELVDMDLTTRNVPGRLAENRYVRFGGKVSFGWLSNDFGPDGHIGDPTGASAEQGKEQFELAVMGLGESLAEVAAFQLPM